MSIDKIIHIIDEAIDKHKEIVLWFFGGEPLLEFDTIKQVVCYCNNIQAQGNHIFHYSITTNGTMLTEQIVKFLNENRFSILISNDGLSELNTKHRPFNAIEKDSSYLSPEEAVLFAINSQIDPRKLAIRATYTDETISYLVDSFVYFREIGIKKIFFAPAIIDDSRMTKKVAEQWVTAIENLVFRLVQSLEIESIIAYPQLTSHLYTLLTKQKVRHGCQMGKSICAIDVDGKKYPCHRMASHSNSGHNEKTDEILLESQQSDPCSLCWAYGMCGGNLCSHINKVWTGNPDTPFELLCFVQKRIIELSCWAYSKLKENEVSIETITNGNPFST